MFTFELKERKLIHHSGELRSQQMTVASWQKLLVYNISAARELPFYVISFKSGFRVCTHAEPTNLRRVVRYQTIISIASLKIAQPTDVLRRRVAAGSVWLRQLSFAPLLRRLLLYAFERRRLRKQFIDYFKMRFQAVSSTDCLSESHITALSCVKD